MGVRVTPGCDPINSFYISRSDSLEIDPEVAFGGGNHMVVWSDRRAGYNYIYAARVTPSGTLLDPGGIQIGPASRIDQYCPNIIFTGSRFIVVWRYSDLPSTFALTGRFVETNGQPADTFRICTLAIDAMFNNTVYDGTNFIVTWLETSSPLRIKGQLVSGNGVPIGSPFTVASTAMGKGSFGHCFDGTNYFITWPDTQVRGRKYNRSGQPLGPSFKVSNSANFQNSPYVIPGAGGRYLNVWNEAGVADYDVYGNLDVMMTGIEESSAIKASSVKLKSRFVRNVIEISGADGFVISIFDVLGRSVGTTRTGQFDCRHLRCGIYFIQVSGSENFKVIKIK